MNQQIVEQLQQGFQLLQAGQIDQAKLCFEAILNVDANNEFALNLLGVTYLRLAQPQQAIDVLHRALKVNQKDSETYANLGLAFKDLNQWSKAQGFLEQSLQINPKQPTVLNNLGNVFAAQNLHQQAAKCFDAALKLAPDYPECLSNFAQSLKEIGQHTIGLKAIGAARKLEPDNSYFANVQGEIELACGQYQAAEKSFNNAISLGDNLVAKVNLSTALKQTGCYAKAKDCLYEVLAIEENNTEAHHHLGVLQEQLGEFDQAASSFRRALQYTPNHASSFYQLAKLKQQSLSKQEVEKINNLLTDPVTPDVFKVSLYLALGVHADKQKHFHQAIEYFIQAKSLKAKKVPYQAEITEQYRHVVKEIQPQVGQGQVVGNMQPVFIVGMPRSGTSLTEQILASHSQVFGAGELGFINDLMKQAEQQTQTRYPYCLTKLSTQSLTHLGQTYKQRITQTFGEHPVVIDKNPLNYNFIGFIKAILPDAKFIYCKRQAMDNCVSIFKLPFDDNQSYAHDLSGLGHYYREHQALMTIWQQQFSDDMLQIDYENMVMDQQQQTQNLMDFLGLDYEDATDEFYKTERIVMTPSAEQVRQPIYTSSVNNWQKYGDAVLPLAEALQIDL
ncbi:tetratricopeptide repeat protein [Thalassotalea litorea]|uniref:Tetratricopeptide repeat protein n=1 Tax=Thalassotalea litorea TaxID=2020715 RepID=A0A5R9INR0_9GAMM|nr:tetratricopeptide repeat-containing sulfotransferase family protein [Thalassotalea litorea]TLU66912.1 tetratricopeptide repeat protein [Thalassotalea litorea]